MTNKILASLSAALFIAACGGGNKTTTTGGGGGASGGDTRPPLTQALDVLPENTGVVIGVRVKAVAEAALARRAWDSMAQQEPDKAAHMAAFRETCGIDFKHFDSIVVGMPLEGGSGIVGHALGSFDEKQLTTCVEAMIGKTGGKLVREDHDGLGHYHIEGESNEDNVWMAFPRAGTAVLADSGANLAAAFDKAGKKARDNASLAAAAGGVAQDKAIWFVAPVPAQIGEQLVANTGGMLESAPTLVRGWVDLGDAMTIEVSATFATSAAAAAAEKLGQQAMGMARSGGDPEVMAVLLDGVSITLEGSDVKIRIVLDGADFDALEKM